MNHLLNLLLLSLLWINLTGLTVASTVFTRLPYGLARVVIVCGGCAVFFFIEHYIGLGNLGWLLPVSTAGSLWVLWRHYSVLRTNWWSEAMFLVGFGYALAWRYTFPNIDPSSEKLADLNFIAGYLQGSHLPPIDPWLYPYKLTQYYSFQHYCAALMGRILQIPAGTSYNVGYCVIVGLVMAPAADFARMFLRSRWLQSAVLAALLLGGTGVCLFTPFLVKHEYLYSSMRFIGSTDAAEKDPSGEDFLTDQGVRLREFLYGKSPIDHEKILEMPMEIFSYVVQLGDYHAPLGGYVLLASALAAFGVLLSRPERHVMLWATGALMGTLPLIVATNAWCFPLHAILVAGCLLFLWRCRQLPNLPEFIGVSIAGWLLMYPFLVYFLPNSVGSGMKIDFFPEHPPPLTYLMQLWPIWTLAILSWFAVPKKENNRDAPLPGEARLTLWESRCFTVCVIGFLALLELVNVDDLYSGRYERFNTTLKWWPWVAFLSFLLLIPLNLRQRKPLVVFAGTLAVIFASLFFVRVLVRDWVTGVAQELKDAQTSIERTHPEPPTFGQLDGAAWLRERDADPMSDRISVDQTIINYLRAHTPGVVLECPKLEGFEQAFTDTGAIPLFTGNPSVLGWTSHEQLWRGYQGDIQQRWDQSRQFFKGEMEEPLDFLEANQVRYILWPGRRLDVDPAIFDKIRDKIESRYLFVRLNDLDPKQGIWVRRED